jgi:hypothetical protein
MDDTPAGGRGRHSRAPGESFNNADRQLEDGIAKIAAKLGNERRSAVDPRLHVFPISRMA